MDQNGKAIPNGLAHLGTLKNDLSPFYMSPRGTPSVTPRAYLGRMSSTAGADGSPNPCDCLKQALIHSRNELVLLFSR